LFLDRWKRSRQAGGVTGPSPAAAATSGPPEAPRARRSNGLEQFFAHIRGETGLNLLDLSGVSQANVGFITELGHRLYSEDLVATLDLAFSGGDFYERQLDPEAQQRFLDENFNFPEQSFDGVLLWDVLEFLAPPLLDRVMERLTAVVKPGAYLFALFHAETQGGAVAVSQYRIGDAGTLLLTDRGFREPAQLFSNRAVEKLFQEFESVKFFLSRDSLREVIVRR
jgi:hypothetical protein